MQSKKRGLALRNSKGFTLIELLIVIAIIAILAAVAFVALDPLSRFQDARDSARWADVNALISAIRVDQVDNKGLYLAEIDAAVVSTEYMISGDTPAPGAGCDVGCGAFVAGAADCIDLSGLVDDGYLGQMPVSPNGGAGGAWDNTHSGYYMIKNGNGSVTVGACEAEGDDPIIVTR